MPQVFGDLDTQAAVFVYKDDGTQHTAGVELARINQRGMIRREIHDQIQQLLDALRAWNQVIDSKNAYICLYAHMGIGGLCCISNDMTRNVTWSELAQALPRRVVCLWLAGCNSQHAIGSWTGQPHPVGQYLVATNDSLYFLPLVPLFQCEIILTRSFSPMRWVPFLTTRTLLWLRLPNTGSQLAPILRSLR